MCPEKGSTKEVLKNAVLEKNIFNAIETKHEVFCNYKIYLDTQDFVENKMSRYWTKRPGDNCGLSLLIFLQFFIVTYQIL